MINDSDAPNLPPLSGQASDASIARRLAAAAERAIAEAEQRRAVRAAKGQELPEVAGRGGLEPVRYGDWEVKGLASDF